VIIQEKERELNKWKYSQLKFLGGEDMITLMIEGRPITKKNSQRILKNHKTGRRFIVPSEAFTNY